MPVHSFQGAVKSGTRGKLRPICFFPINERLNEMNEMTSIDDIDSSATVILMCNQVQ